RSSGVLRQRPPLPRDSTLVEAMEKVVENELVSILGRAQHAIDVHVDKTARQFGYRRSQLVLGLELAERFRQRSDGIGPATKDFDAERGCLIATDRAPEQVF